MFSGLPELLLGNHNFLISSGNLAPEALIIVSAIQAERSASSVRCNLYGTEL